MPEEADRELHVGAFPGGGYWLCPIDFGTHLALNKIFFKRGREVGVCREASSGPGACMSAWI